MISFQDIPYTRPDFDSFKAEFTGLLNDFNSASSVDVQNTVMMQINDARNELDTAFSLVSVRNSLDTTDPYYDAEQKFMDDLGPLYSELTTQYYQSLAGSRFRKELEHKWGSQLFRLAELSTKCFSPEIIGDLQNENRLSTEYQNLLASASIPFDGENRNLAAMSPYMQSTDRDVRRSASAAKWKFFSDNKDQLDYYYSALVKLRTDIAHRLGYKNFVELGYNRMGRSDYNPSMIAEYREKIHRHIVPITQRLRKRQAHRLGLDSLKFYDEGLQYKTGNPTPKGSPEWIVERAKTMYAEMSSETNEFFTFMYENNLMDLVNRPNKAGGGYCTMLPKYKAPFIFSNFNGTSHDVDVLTHEAGHAFQCYMSRNNGVAEYYFPTMEACEIHSMSMEFFAWKWMKQFFQEDEDKYQFEHLGGSLLFLPYGVTVDEFQHYVYDNPTATAIERKQAWLKIEQKYLPHRDYDGEEFLEEGGLWQQQKHIYQSPFYYIDYTLAQICALQFWVRNKTDQQGAWKDYVHLCTLGGSKSFLELVKEANLHSPFEEASFTTIVNDINSRLDGIPDTIFG